MKRAKRGFTLIEVICVLTIIAIIAAIAVPNISGYIKKSKERNCESVMTNFVNDLEYKIVSKRFYDISELNGELIGVVNSYADEVNADSAPNDGVVFEYLNEKITSATGICPNGGKYTVEWKITPGKAENINSAAVDVQKCECDCMGDETHITVKTHSYTAALVASGEYVDAELSLEEILGIELENTVKEIEASGDYDNPSAVESIRSDFSNEKYTIAGLSINETSKKVEWISMYYNSNFDAENPSENNYKFFTLSRGNVIITDISAEDYNDKLKWPPAEGTNGSYVFKEGWSAGMQYQVANVNDTIPGADAEHSVTVGWIQRDGQWYVQKNNDVKGIDLTAEEADGHLLVSPDNDSKLNASKVLGITPDQNADFSNLKNSLKITAKYENNTEVKFGHLGVSDSFFSESADEYTIRNGYIIVSSREDVSGINWAGIFKKDSDQSDKEALKKLLENENTLINDFKSAIESGKTETLTIAYQEYFKSYNSAAGEYTYEPVTVFGTVTCGNSYNADDSRKILVDEDNETLKVPVKFPLTVNGSESTEIDIPAYIELPLFGEDKLLSGVTDVVLKDTAVAVIEVVENGYDIVYKQPESADGKFRVEDISVGKKLTYIIKDKKTGEEIGRIEDKAEIKHCSEGGSEGFYISDWNNPANESQWVDNINDGRGGARIFVTGVDTPICGIGDVNPTYSWSYDKKSDDTDFSPENINLKIFYEIELYPESGYTASAEGKVVCEMKHKTTASADEDGFYIAEGEVTDPSQETGTIEKINGHTSGAYLKVYRNSDREFNNKTIGVIKTELTGIDAVYDNKADSEFSFENLTAKAKYTITVYDNVNTSDIKAVINHEETLNHDADPDAEYRYFVSKTESTNISYVRNNEKSAISELNKAQEGYYYVVYSDVTTLCKDIYVNVKAGINPSEIVYIPDGNNTAHMIAYLGAGNVLNIPSSHEGYWSLSEPEGDEKYIKVEAGSQGVYYYIDDGKTYSITRIGDNPAVFPQNSQSESKVKMPPHTIKTVSIEDGVREIGPYAFQGLRMEDGGSISIPDSIETIGIGAFENCGGNNLKKITLGTFSVSGDDYKSSSKLTTIGASAFQNCNSLEENDVFIIPESVKSIGNDAFNEFRMSNGTFVINGVSEYAVPKEYSRSSTPDGANTVHAADTNGAEGTITNKPFGWLTVNSLVIGGNVERIGDEAFVQKIGDNFNSTLHFNNNATSRLVIGGSVKTVGAYAFAGADFDDELVFGDSVTNIGTGAFENCATYTGTLDLNRITDIGGYAFSGMINATGGLEIPQYINNVAGHAFRNFAANTEAKALKLYAGTVNGTEVGGWVFDGANFDGITVAGDRITKISDYAFNNEASIETDNKLPYNNIRGELEITATGITFVGVSAFRNCTGLTGSVIIPASVKTINNNAFSGCEGLNGTLEFRTTSEKGITSIGSNAFSGCSNMYSDSSLTDEQRNLTIPDSVSYIGRNAFTSFGEENTAKSLTILGTSSGYYLGGNGNAGGSYPIFNDSKFVNVTIGGNVKQICDGFMDTDGDYDYSKITGSLEFTSDCNLNIIGENAFRGCAFTGNLEFPDKLTIIGNEAFSNCTFFKGSLDTKNVTAIGTRAFLKCKGFDGTLSIGKVQKIGESAFEECENFSGDLFIPSSVYEIKKHAFYYFAGKSSGTHNLKIYGSSLSSEDKTVREITPFIFSLANFENITIGGAVTKISNMAFENVGYENVKDPYANFTGSLTVEENVTVIADSAFKNCVFSGDINISKVNIIGNDAFKNCSAVSGNLDISSATEIGTSAFEGLENIHSDLYIPNSVTKIGENAFVNFASNLGNNEEKGRLLIYGCSGKEAESDMYGYLGSNIFTGSKFNSVLIAGNVKTIQESAFRYCSGMEGMLTIGGNVENIEKLAFGECTGFTGLSLESRELHKIYEGAFVRCKNISSDLVIPKSVYFIQRCAFKEFGSAVKGEPGSLTVYGTSDEKGNLGNPDRNSDGDPIFSAARFKNVTIGGNVKYINHDQFNGSKGYKEDKNDDEPNGYKFNVGKCEGDTENYQVDDVRVDGAYTRYPFGAYDANSDFSGITGDLIIEDGVKYIGNNAFSCVAFDNITVPESVTEIGYKAFSYTGTGNGDLKIFGSSKTFEEKDSSGKTVTVRELGRSGKPENASGDSDNNYNENSLMLMGAKFRDVIIGGSVTRIGADFMHNCDSYEDGRFTETVNGKTYSYNVKYSDITGTITIGNSVKEIEENAFESCNFSGRLLLGEAANFERVAGGPANSMMTSIGKFAFKNCSNLNGDLVIPSGMKSIGEDAFYHFNANDTENNKAGALIIWGGSSDSGNTLDGKIFNGAKFKDVLISGNVHKIAAEAFYNVKNENSNLARSYDGITGKLTLGPSVWEIGDNAFNSCKFDDELIICDLTGRKIKGENGVSADDPEALDRNSLHSVKIGQNAFANCNDFYKNYVLHEGETQPVFTIPENVVSIGLNAFKSMSSSINDKSKRPALQILGSTNENDRSFGSCTQRYTAEEVAKDKSLEGKTGYYKSVDVFPDAKFNNVSFGGKVTVIAERAFDNSTGKYDGLTGSLSFGSGITAVWSDAFSSCSGFDGTLTFNSVTKTEGDSVKVYGVEHIGDRAFSNCEGFTGNLNFPDSLKTIESNAFYECEGFDGTISLSENLRKIGDRAFVRCTHIGGGLKIPSSVTLIGASAFKEFAELAESPGLLEIYGNSGTVAVTENGREISAAALVNPSPSTNIFTACKFNGVTIGGNVKIIGDDLFNNWAHINQDNDSRTEKFVYNKNAEDDAKYKSGWEKDNNSLYSGFSGKLTIQDSVKSIGMLSFAGSRFDEVTIGSGVTEIGSNAFMYSGTGKGKLTVMGGSLNDIIGLSKDSDGNYNMPVFAGSQYNGVEICGSVHSVGADFMHHDTGRTSVFFNEENAYEVPWDYSGMKGNIVIGSSVSSIGNSAFEGCEGFDGQLLLGGVQKIGASAFSRCTNFYSSYTTSDGKQAEFEIPYSVTQIGADAFESMCSNIPESDFGKVPKLKILGASLDTGNEKAFGSTGPWNSTTQKYDTISIFKNAKFNNVYISTQTIAEGAFDNTSGIYNNITGDYEIASVNVWSKAFYKINSGELGTHRGRLILDDTVKNIGDYVFQYTKFFGDYYDGERELKIPDSVETIGTGAFSNFCSNFGNPPSLTMLGTSSTKDVKISSIQSVSFIQGIGNWLSGKTTLTIRSIGSEIFTGSNFKTVTIGDKNVNQDNITVIDEKAFSGCTGLTGKLTLYCSVCLVYKNAFQNTGFSELEICREHVKYGENGDDWDEGNSGWPYYTSNDRRNAVFGNSDIPVTYSKY